MSTTTREQDRARLEVLIGTWDEANDAYAEHFGEMAWCYQTYGPVVEEEEWWDDAERKGEDLEAELDRLAAMAADLAKRCVPVATIFALPEWLKVAMFGPQH